MLAPPNDYAVVTRSDGLVVGQLAGYPVNITVYSSDSTVVGASITVQVCVPEAQFVKPFYSGFQGKREDAKKRSGKSQKVLNPY